MKSVEFADNSMCFACGKKNADGLHLEFDYTGKHVRTTVAFPKKFQGYGNIVHGGLISTVLDETMVTLLNRMGHLAVTAELSVRFLSPLSVGQTVTVTAGLIEARRRTFRVAATAILPDGTRIATGEARCVSMGPLPSDLASS
jgi:uncharacterized protein (TIGR00369 family)